MTTAQDVIDVAGSQVGYVEGSNNDNRFGAWYGANYVPWCAEFQSWVFWTAFHSHGQTSPLEGIQNAKGVAYCPLVVNWARNRGLWRPSPQRGSLVLFDWNHDGTSDHIGLCISGEDGAGNFTTIEGNTSLANWSNGGMVARETRSNHRGYCLGFVDLSGSYAAAPAPPAPPTPAPAPAPSGAPPWPGVVLLLTSPYMRNAEVTTWQQQMAHRGWTIGTDGVYGPQSANVCRAFQTDKHLVVDGVVGPATWTASWTSPVT